MSRLVPCVGCSRHFRATEAACPFCGRGSEESLSSARVPPRLEGRPLTRAAILFATAATATGVMACGKTSGDPDATTYQGLVQPYGVPAPLDAGQPEPPPPLDASPGHTMPHAVPPYGVAAPPPENGPGRKGQRRF